MKWKPIETAPKNELVLVAIPGIKPRVAFQSNVNRLVRDRPEDWKWRVNGIGVEVFPTHWMPLPEPPE